MTDVRTLDTARLAPWLRTHVPGTAGEISAEKFAGGQSNPTYLLSVDGQPRFVLRRKPDGVLLPSAVLSSGTSAFASGKYAAAQPRAVG